MIGERVGRLGLEEEHVKYLDLFLLRSSLNSEALKAETLTSMPTISKLYAMQEASQHNTKDDCWVVIDGKVRAFPQMVSFSVFFNGSSFLKVGSSDIL